ncbi:MAG: class II aldolase/adducin family protein, partial [Planctomycetota bacterium]
MESRWDAGAARGLEGRELLAYLSRLLGAERDLVLRGGGNTSVKTVEPDRLGRPTELLHVKPSGVDLAAIRPEDFTALRLGDLRPLAEGPPLTDAEMSEHVSWTAVDPRARRPSIETMLHAFLPERFVLHSHADALLALCNRRDGAARVAEALGADVALVPYRRPGFLLA